MPNKKHYTLIAARPAWPSELPIIVAQIPWEHFCLKGGPDAYASQIAKANAIPVIVSKGPDGVWGSATVIETVFQRKIAQEPLDTLEWHPMSVECDFYPWETVGI
jgi:hypothetical protein